MSKRSDRIALAKQREPLETEKLRLRERTKIPSKVARFLPIYTKQQQLDMEKRTKAIISTETIPVDIEKEISDDQTNLDR